MTTKYLLSKAVVVATMLAGLTVTGCCDKDKLDDPEYELKNPEVIKTVDGATIVANTLSDVDNMLTQIASDISDSLQAAKDYVITIDAPSLKASESDHTISLPLCDYLSNNPTGKAKVVVKFTNPLSTDVPLVIQAKGATGPAVAAQNKVELNITSGLSDIDLNLNMPATTVTLKAKTGTATINELISVTATDALIIGNGITVNWLLLNDGNVAVKEGGKVLGFLGDLYVCNEGVKNPNVFKNEVTDSPKNDDYYYVQKGKIIKNNDGNYGTIAVWSATQPSDTEVDIIIADGAKASINAPWNTNIPMINVTGEGNATIINKGYKSPGGKVNLTNQEIYLFNFNKLTNVTVDLAKAVILNDETGEYEDLEVDQNEWSEIYLPVNSENCTFNAKHFVIWSPCFKKEVLSSTHKGCTFNSLEADEEFIVRFPSQNENRKSFTAAFDACQFDKVAFCSEFKSGAEYEDFKSYLSFDNSKIGGKAITKDTEMIYDVKSEAGATTFYLIDGITYKTTKVNDKWTMERLAD